jgi:sterol desaturase/sphingolipid hydroxylase (fatty acid hydroxylase superfamily)
MYSAEQFDIDTTLIFIVAIILESTISVLGQYKWYDLKDSFRNVLMAFLNLTLDFAFKGVTYFVLEWFHQFAIIEWSSVLWRWVALILLEDLAYYALHWVDHNVRFFWAVHVTHHSSQKMNFSVAIRSSVFQPLYRFVFFIPLAILGFHAIDILLAYAICNAWGFFIHTEAIGKLGWMEKIFATPSNHRVHHGSNPQYIDRNMGMFLIIWDRIFGTYQEENEKVIYGLTKNIDDTKISNILFHEWKSMIADVKHAPGLRNKLMYIFGPPGWNHLTAEITERESNNNNSHGFYYSSSQINNNDQNRVPVLNEG